MIFYHTIPPSPPSPITLPPTLTPSLTSPNSSASFEPENFLLREPYSFLARLVLSFSWGDCITFGSGMSPMNRRIITQISRAA